MRHIQKREYPAPNKRWVQETMFSLLREKYKKYGIGKRPEKECI
jgi:hypothetical protein